MTNLQKIYKFNTSNFPSKISTIGFDRWADIFDLDVGETVKNSGFPPHNIVKTSEYNYILELAVAGFTENDIDITLEKNKITVVGNIKNKDEPEYIYRGIATRSFTKVFTLMDTIVVEGASLQDGILKVFLRNSIPEEEKPRKITINKIEPATINQQLLTED